MKKNNTLSSLPNNCINAHVSCTLCVQTGTTDWATADPRHECRGPPGGRGPQFKNRWYILYTTCKSFYYGHGHCYTDVKLSLKIVHNIYIYYIILYNVFKKVLNNTATVYTRNILSKPFWNTYLLKLYIFLRSSNIHTE